ncbi:MAG: hypothetical protein ACE5HO_20430 [bacterium]
MTLLNRTKLKAVAALYLVAVAWSRTVMGQPVPFNTGEDYQLSSARAALKTRLVSLPRLNFREAPGEAAGQENTGRVFFFKEVVLSAFYSFDGVSGLPPSDLTKDHFEISPRPPGNYIGLDYVKTFTSSSLANKVLPDWLPLTAMNLHPRLVYDRMERNGGLDRIKVAPQDFWLRFNPGGLDRLNLRVGQFVIPYGVNPILAPRQQFLLPVEATDLGLKWDWGLDLKGPAGEYDWEIAMTIGSGEGVHAPRLLTNSDRRRYLITGRIGAPTYWDFQQGLSFLYGDLPVIMGPTIFSDVAISRWRIGYDAFYKYGTYLMLGGQLAYGQDGFAGDAQFVMVTRGKSADVFSLRVWADWVIPKHQDVRLTVQFESVVHDLATAGSDDTAAIFQLGYSFTTTITTMLHYRQELNRAIGEKNNAVYFTFIYYGS